MTRRFLASYVLPVSLLTLVSAGALTHRAAEGTFFVTASVPAPPPPGLPGTLHLDMGKSHKSWLRGVASWYGELWEGRVTASGEVFHTAEMTACHPTLPFGTLVRVINLRNRRSVIVRINDRGTLRPNRIIDLSSAAADRLGILRAGTAPVKLEIVGRSETTPV